MITPVIIAGGSGSRLWPLSRELYPKQFLHLIGEDSMLQTTIQRLDGLPCKNPIVICNEQHRFIVADQLHQLNKLDSNVILEPVGRNTAPAIALAALTAIKNSPESDPILLVLAADHVIKNEDIFRNAVCNSLQFARSGKLVTFGIVPDKPETGYGYIRKDLACLFSENSLYSAFNVREFVEKPDLVTASDYIKSGEYYWNSGMFLFGAKRYLDELRTYHPDIVLACEKAIYKADYDLDFIRIKLEDFIECPDKSIDYAVMEKTKDAVVFPIDAGWSDVGSWSSLWDVSEKNLEGNVSNGDVISYETQGCYIYAESALVTTIGTKNLIVVQTKDAVLIAEREKSQEVKKIVEHMKLIGRNEYLVHRKVHRPWGKYDLIDEGEGYQIKRITVNPKEGLSLQIHHHRAEYWIVVTGTARVTIGNNITLLSENESIYVPVDVVHSLENVGEVPLNIIEVRSGVYLGEDDVIRLKSKYSEV